jgi:hypothetical protein
MLLLCLLEPRNASSLLKDDIAEAINNFKKALEDIATKHAQ